MTTIMDTSKRPSLSTKHAVRRTRVPRYSPLQGNDNVDRAPPPPLPTNSQKSKRREKNRSQVNREVKLDQENVRPPLPSPRNEAAFHYRLKKPAPAWQTKDNVMGILNSTNTDTGDNYKEAFRTWTSEYTTSYLNEDQQFSGNEKKDRKSRFFAFPRSSYKGDGRTFEGKLRDAVHTSKHMHRLPAKSLNRPSTTSNDSQVQEHDDEHGNHDEMHLERSQGTANNEGGLETPGSAYHTPELISGTDDGNESSRLLSGPGSHEEGRHAGFQESPPTEQGLATPKELEEQRPLEASQTQSFSKDSLCAHSESTGHVRDNALSSNVPTANGTDRATHSAVTNAHVHTGLVSGTQPVPKPSRPSAPNQSQPVEELGTPRNHLPNADQRNHNVQKVGRMSTNVGFTRREEIKPRENLTFHGQFSEKSTTDQTQSVHRTEIPKAFKDTVGPLIEENCENLPGEKIASRGRSGVVQSTSDQMHELLQHKEFEKPSSTPAEATKPVAVEENKTQKHFNRSRYSMKFPRDGQYTRHLKLHTPEVRPTPKEATAVEQARRLGAYERFYFDVHPAPRPTTAEKKQEAEQFRGWNRAVVDETNPVFMYPRYPPDPQLLKPVETEYQRRCREVWGKQARNTSPKVIKQKN